MTTIESILHRLTEAVSGTGKKLYTENELTKFATFYLGKWDENTSEDVIAESFTYIYIVWLNLKPNSRCKASVGVIAVFRVPM